MKPYFALTLFLTISDFAFSWEVDTHVDLKLHESNLIPDIIDDVKGILRLNVSFPSGVHADLGNTLTPEQTKDQPMIELNNEDNDIYTLLMTDAGKHIEKAPSLPEMRNWLIVNIPSGDMSKGEKVVDFLPSAPLKNTGLHRFTFLLFKQPNGKISIKDSSPSIFVRFPSSTKRLIGKYDLKLVAANYYVQEYDEYVMDIIRKSIS